MPSRITLVATSIGNAINTAINTAGFTTPTQVVFGFPMQKDLEQILSAMGVFISLYPQDGSGATPMPGWLPYFMPITAPSTTLTVAVSGQTITFGGTPQYLTNIHALWGSPETEAFYQVSNIDTLGTIAQGVKAALTAKTISASVSGNSVILTQPLANLHVNLGSQGQAAREASRLNRTLQVDTWCPTPEIRDALDEIIIQNIGTKTKAKFPLGDGTDVWCKLKNSTWSDEKQTSDNIFRGIYLFDINYGNMEYATATQIGAIVSTYTNQLSAVIKTIVDG
jgi:hypothetical protein